LAQLVGLLIRCKIEHDVRGQQVAAHGLTGMTRSIKLGHSPRNPVEAEFVDQRNLLRNAAAAGRRVHGNEGAVAAVRASRCRWFSQRRDVPTARFVFTQYDFAAAFGKRCTLRITQMAKQLAIVAGSQLQARIGRKLRHRFCPHRRAQVGSDDARVVAGSRAQEAAHHLLRRKAHVRHRIRSCRRRECECMLPRQVITLPRKPKSMRRHFTHHLSLAHHVLRFDRHVRVLGAELNQHHAPTIPQRPPNVCHDAHWMG